MKKINYYRWTIWTKSDSTHPLRSMPKIMVMRPLNNGKHVIKEFDIEQMQTEYEFNGNSVPQLIPFNENQVSETMYAYFLKNINFVTEFPEEFYKNQCNWQSFKVIEDIEPMTEFIDVKTKDIDRLRGIHKKIDDIIDICQQEWEGSTSRIGHFKISLDEQYGLSISFSPRFHFENSNRLHKIIEIIEDDSELEEAIKGFNPRGVATMGLGLPPHEVGERAELIKEFFDKIEGEE